MYPFLRYFSELIYLNLFKCARLGYPLTCFMFSQFHIINCPKNNTSLLLFSELQSRSLRWNHWLVYIGVLWFFITVSSIHNIVIHDQKVNYLHRCEILCIYDLINEEKLKQLILISMQSFQISNHIHLIRILLYNRTTNIRIQKIR